MKTSNNLKQQCCKQDFEFWRGYNAICSQPRMSSWNCARFHSSRTVHLNSVTAQLNCIMEVEDGKLNRRSNWLYGSNKAKLSLNADNTYQDLDYSRYQKNQIIVLLSYNCFKENNEKPIMLKKQINQPCSHFAIAK